MILLAVETSGTRCSVALAIDDQAPVLLPLQTSGKRHAQTLVSDAGQLLRTCRIAPQEIQVIAVSIGPGSFTGLRVGLVFAKTLAWATGAKLTAVDTLQAIAQQSPEHSETVTAVVDAQRGEVFAAEYRWNPEKQMREALTSLSVVAPEHLNPSIPISGPALTRFGEQLIHTHRLMDESCWLPLASTIADLGRIQVRNSQFSSPVELEPVYVRRSYAEEKRDSAGAPA